MDRAVATIAHAKMVLGVIQCEAPVGVWRAGLDETARSEPAHTAGMERCAIRRANACLTTLSSATLGLAFALAILAGMAPLAPGLALSSDLALSV